MSTPNFDVRSVVHQLLNNIGLTPGGTVSCTADQFSMRLIGVLDLMHLIDAPGTVFAAATNDEKGYAFDALSEVASDLRFLLENYNMPAGYEKRYEVPVLPMYAHGYLKQRVAWRVDIETTKRPRWLLPATIIWAIVGVLWLTAYLLGW